MVPANIAIAQRFVELATFGPIPTMGALARVLDELALIYHDTPAGDPSESDNPPPSEIAVGRAAIAARFFDLGYYGKVFGIEVSAKAIVGDAIDDILDITNGLKEVLWRFTQNGVDDANWHFRFLFQMHWGDHLHGLANYLYWRMRSEGN